MIRTAKSILAKVVKTEVVMVVVLLVVGHFYYTHKTARQNTCRALVTQMANANAPQEALYLLCSRHPNFEVDKSLENAHRSPDVYFHSGKAQSEAQKEAEFLRAAGFESEVAEAYPGGSFVPGVVVKLTTNATTWGIIFQPQDLRPFVGGH